MKNVLKLSLAGLAIATLAACGGGGSSDVTDAYVGTWKSICFASTNSPTFTKRIRTYTKVSATEMTSSTTFDGPFSDAGCANSAGNWSSNVPSVSRYVLGAKITYLGANADSYTVTFADNTQNRGYMIVDGSKLFLVDTPTTSAPPSGGWSIYAPYTKQ